MVTFTEEILNRKLHFLCSVMRVGLIVIMIVIIVLVEIKIKTIIMMAIVVIL